MIVNESEIRQLQEETEDKIHRVCNTLMMIFKISIDNVNYLRSKASEEEQEKYSDYKYINQKVCEMIRIESDKNYQESKTNSIDNDLLETFRRTQTILSISYGCQIDEEDVLLDVVTLMSNNEFERRLRKAHSDAYAEDIESKLPELEAARKAEEEQETVDVGRGLDEPIIEYH